MPVAVCAVIRTPRKLKSRRNAPPPVSATSATFDTSNSGSLALISSILTYRGLAAAFPTCSPPRLLDAAAVGGLEPPSDRRLRGVNPHLRHSTARRPASRSWHTCEVLQRGARGSALPIRAPFIYRLIRAIHASHATRSLTHTVSTLYAEEVNLPLPDSPTRAGLFEATAGASKVEFTSDQSDITLRPTCVTSGRSAEFTA
jgi:hypothetical protein